MPILDMHVHAGNKGQWTPWVGEFFDKLNPRYAEIISDATKASDLVRFFDQEGIDKAVILSEYTPLSTGVVPNEWTAAFCAQAPDRLIPFGSVCLYEGAPTGDQVEYGVRELGICGLKLAPPYGHFHPGDPRLGPAYEAAQGFGIPIMFHTGTSLFKGSRIKYANPLLLDDVAEDFPELKIIISHGGRPFWYQEAEWLLRRHRNTSIDISGIPPQHLPTAFPHFERLQDRFVFGTDWPGVSSPAQQVAKIRELPFSAQALDKLFWGNAGTLLGLNG